MKQLITLLALMIAVTSVSAQNSLNIGKIFGEKYRQNEKTTETIIMGDALKGTGLDTYRSIVIRDSPELADEISTAVIKDGSDALSREVKYIDGKIYYAHLMLKPLDKYNRYIFYLNTNLNGGNKIMLLYMIGKANLDEIKKLIRQQ